MKLRNLVVVLAVLETSFPISAQGPAAPGTHASPTPSLSPSPSSAVQRTPCRAPIYRQFDFWIGEWDVVNPEGKFVGTNRVERAGDCYLLENWAAAGGGYTGRSLNSPGFDRRWHQTWTDTSGLRLELSGGLIDGKMVLEGETPSQDPKNPAPTRNRITWSQEAGGVVRQHWETSGDGGRSWSTSFDGRYHRADGARNLPDGFFRTVSGTWIGSGTLNRAPSRSELSISRGPGSTIKLSWRSIIAPPAVGGAPAASVPARAVFEGFAVYEQKGRGEFVAVWWDTQGSKHDITASVSADGYSLVALWGDRGKTVYQLNGAADLQVTDSVKQPDGSWVEFATATLKRQ